jgi:hypothetical protein
MKNRLHMPSSLKKGPRLELLRRFFFRDDACTRPDTDLLKELDRHMHGSTNNGQHKRPHANITPAAAAAAAAPPNGHYRGLESNSNVQYTPSHASASLQPHSNGFAMLANGHYPPSGNHFSNPFLFPPPYFNMLPPAPASAHRTPPPSTTPPSSKSSTKVKQEARQKTPVPAAPPPPNPTQPSTPQEATLFAELRQMGFTDVQELLTAIRNFTTPSDDTTTTDNDNNNAAAAAAPTLANSEQVMMWIISQREEAEEAKKMDEARLRSESLRKEQAELQKRAAQERLDAAGLTEFKELFPGSWILQDSKLPLDTWVETIKDSLVELLNLEKQAIKFYGVKLPRGYFEQLCLRLEECSNSSSSHKCKIKTEMKNECEILQTALYRLSEQQGGVPRIFLTTATNLGNDDLDDDIVIVHNSTSNGSEVIEIE